MENIISIIIPVFNVEQYLNECLDSVLSQKLENYEVICVNDGSTDSSRHILQQYKQRYNNLSIVDRKNGGLSAARNSGLKVATGKYIFFLDSDDFILPDTVREIINYAEKNNLEVVAFSAATDGGFEYTNKNFRYDIVGSGVEYYENYIKKNKTHPFSNVWLYLYKKSFLDSCNLEFNEGIYHEDVPFTMRMFFYVKRISYLSMQVIFYRKFREGAITNNVTRKHLIDQAVTYRGLYNFFINNKFQNVFFYERIYLGYLNILISAGKSKISKLNNDIFTREDSRIMKKCARESYGKKISTIASFSPGLAFKYYENKLPGYLRKGINTVFSIIDRRISERI
jgi:glycosyltransferase involved in cell wall biosynthesis